MCRMPVRVDVDIYSGLAQTHALPLFLSHFFPRRLLVSYSYSAWRIDACTQPFSYQVDKILAGHNAAVNVVDLTEEHIVSASGDRTIR
jgi:hypothetical protein